MGTTAYKDALSRAERLSREEQMRLLGELEARLRSVAPSQNKRSIMELQAWERTCGEISMPSSTLIGSAPRGMDSQIRRIMKAEAARRKGDLGRGK